MRILTINCGSSTLKFDLLEVNPGAGCIDRSAGGAIDRVGEQARARFTRDGETEERELEIRDHRDAFEAARQFLEASGLLSGIEAAGHRVVHGGARFRAATVVDDDVLSEIEAASELAPLHNRPALAVLKAARASFGGGVRMVAAFDTAFYAGLPESTALYAIPKDVSARHGIRRYGFHGLAHASMVRRFKALLPDIVRPRLITLQLGNGCSATASVDGAAVDTSMGYTPLEGLIMGTRSGDLDPALALRLPALMGTTAEEAESMLNHRSGLLGLSGRSADMRDLEAAAAGGDADAGLAIEAFCVRAKKYAGAYMALLGGADGLVFGGGIGENSPEVRARICSGLEWAGLHLDPDANRGAVATEARVSTPESKVEILVAQVDEAAEIARQTAELLGNDGR